jgi:hypothetical protein
VKPEEINGVPIYNPLLFPNSVQHFRFVILEIIFTSQKCIHTEMFHTFIENAQSQKENPIKQRVVCR